MRNLFDDMNACFNHQFGEVDRPVEPKEHNLFSDGEIEQLRKRLIDEKLEEIKAEGVDALINHDVLEENSIAQAYKAGDWVQFGKLTNLALKASAERIVNAMDDLEVWAWFQD